MTSVAIVSIGRNNLSGLQLTIKSVLSQEMQPAQLIVVDGASTDGTVDWLGSAKLPPYSTVISEPDRGIYDALNKGLSRVHSDLVLFINAGDRLEGSDVLARIVASYKSTKWAWAFGDSILESASGGPDRYHRLREKRWLKFICGLGSVPHQATIMTKSMLESIGWFDLEAGVCADQEHILRAWLASPPHYLGFTVARCEPAGISSEQPPGHFARHMKAYRKRHRIVLGFISPVDSLITNGAVYWNRTRQRAAL